MFASPEFMFASPEKKIDPPVGPEEKENEPQKSPDRMISFGNKMIELFCKDFKVDGMENFENFKREHPNDKMIITASHMNNLDMPAVLKVFGPKMNIQVSGNELHFKKLKYVVQQIGERIIFGDNFTKLGQKEHQGVESGVLRSDNFSEIDKKIAEGRTLWMAAHSFSKSGKMRKVDNGALIEAYRQNAWLLPTTLEVRGGTKSLQGVGEITKNISNKYGATYHIGEAYKPDPLPEGLDINVIEEVINERRSGKKASDIPKFEEFKQVRAFLSEQSEKLGEKIANMLPEEQRGAYEKKE